MFAVEMQHISKRFELSSANNDVNFSVLKGEIHSLVGENGAGKSTLMNILYGIYRPDAGTILVNNKTVIISNPAKAISLGIGMVHQHFMLLPTFTITENIILGKEPSNKLGLVDTQIATKNIEELSQQYHLNISPNEKVESQSVGQQQRVEILKILYRNAETLIFDEPTAVLTPQESEELFAIFALLKSQGKTIIFISHKLNEVMSISDRITVMRHGNTIDTVEAQHTNESMLAQMMVGKELPTVTKKYASTATDIVLSVTDLSVKNDKNIPMLKNISFNVHSGEILGIAAVEGNGQSELVQVLTGLRRSASGQACISGKNILGRMSNMQVAHIPEDRLKYGIIFDFNIKDNLILGRQYESQFSSSFVLHNERIASFSEEQIQQYDIRPANMNQLGRELSGGNQQKVVIARELSKDAPLIVASQPTRGLDFNAQYFVHQALLEERKKGKAILLVSSDLTELLKLSDRIAVLYDGEVVATFLSSRASEKELGLYMTGAQRKAS